MGNDAKISPSDVVVGWEALRRGAWEEARGLFSSALVGEETPEALEGLAMATWWLDDSAVALQARERAYRLFQDRGDSQAAARVAIWLAIDSLVFRREEVVANGWLRRAHRLLDGLEPTPEHGFLAAQEGQIAIRFHHDPATARVRATDVIAIGRSLGILDLEMLGLALEGLALVAQGEVDDGMQRLDEATRAAVSGEMRDPRAICLTCCNLIYACEQVRDFDRAAQWCKYAKEFCQHWGIRYFFALCRAQYAAVFVARGAWAEAEVELTEAVDELRVTRPGQALEGIARLGELRRRQGRLEEADSLFKEAEPDQLAQVGRAALALDRGDARGAVELCERFLRGLPECNRTERAAALELLACGLAGLGDAAGAASSVQELRALADAIGTEPLAASATFAEGMVAAATGDDDCARRSFEDAVDLFEHSGSPFEAARVRLELARTLLAQGRTEPARSEACAASEVLTRLGATCESDRAAALLRETEAGSRRDGRVAGLTPREQEVLRLMAEGLANQEIAGRLMVSEHTVHRHVANILGKLRVSSRAAAATFAASHGLL